MKIEKMTFADLQPVTVLAEQLGYPEKLSAIQTRFLKIESSPNYALFVAKSENERILGYIQVNALPHTLLADQRAEVAALIVEEKERGKGVGAALLSHAEIWAKENELPLMCIRSNVKRSDAHRFYEKKGYALKKSWHLFTKLLT